jgi:hypothetical protein
MQWSDLERSFSRAVLFSFSKKKLLLAFPVLVLCGIFTVFCRAIAIGAGNWISMSLAFLPILLSSGVLLALGVLLIRIYLYEVKNIELSFDQFIKGSLDLMMGTSYLSVPPILIYLLLWILLGFFFLLGEIPGIGDFFSVVFAFGPFLLILGSLLLCLLNLALLFFVTPAAALRPLSKNSLGKKVLLSFQGKMLSSIALFLIALVPIIFVSALLSLSAILTNLQLGSERSLAVVMEWFFIMLPFCALLTPSIVFFFNFAAESYHLLQTKSALQ